MLEDEVRSALYRWSVAFCSIALGLLPLAARSSIKSPGIASTFGLGRIATVAPIDRRRPLVFLRDPFQPAVDARSKMAISGEIVRGVVLGERPQAIVDERGREELIGIGSNVAGSQVLAIDPDGVVLANGTFLRLIDDGAR
jgi:hypothetical protein